MKGINAMRFLMKSGLIALMTTAAISVANAETEPYGQGYGGWSFSQEGRKDGSILCRAVRGGFVLAAATDGTGYVSVPANGLTGRFPGSRLNLVDGSIEVNAVVMNTRLVFPGLDEYALNQIAGDGGYVWVLSKGKGSDEVDLGDRASEAMTTAFECVEANS
jgi:hypothetical protein